MCVNDLLFILALPFFIVNVYSTIFCNNYGLTTDAYEYTAIVTVEWFGSHHRRIVDRAIDMGKEWSQGIAWGGCFPLEWARQAIGIDNQHNEFAWHGLIEAICYFDHQFVACSAMHKSIFGIVTGEIVLTDRPCLPAHSECHMINEWHGTPL